MLQVRPTNLHWACIMLIRFLDSGGSSVDELISPVAYLMFLNEITWHMRTLGWVLLCRI